MANLTKKKKEKTNVSRWVAVFLCFSLIALVFPIFLVPVAAFPFDYADAPPPGSRGEL